MPEAFNDKDHNARPHVVLLVHGIRTYADWAEDVKKLLCEEPDIRVVIIRYGYFDLFQFLIPGPWRMRPVRKLVDQLSHIQVNPNTKSTSVIAHSYGTYAITKALSTATHIRLNRLILCGSIISRNESWGNLSNRINTKPLNECGKKDIWPILAESATWGFGASGTYGFGIEQVIDRFHPFKHSDFFKNKDKMVKDYWIPWLVKGEFSYRECSIEYKTPIWWTLLTKIKLKWIILVVIICVGYRFLSPDMSYMSFIRIADYTSSTCNREGKRVFIERFSDTYNFNDRIVRYTPVAYVKECNGINVVLKDEKDSELTPNKSCKKQPCCDSNTYTWNKALDIVDGTAKATWIWTAPAGNTPDGISVKGRYPLEYIQFEVRLPDGVKVESWHITPYNIAPQCRQVPSQPNKPEVLKVECTNLRPFVVVDQVDLEFDGLQGWNDCR